MAKKQGRPPKIDEAGREILRDIVTAQPYATLDEVTAEFTQRTELTVKCRYGAQSAAAGRGETRARCRGGQAAVAGGGSGQATLWLHGRTSPSGAGSALSELSDADRVGIGGGPVRATGNARATAAVQPLGDGECVLLRGAQRLFLAHVAARVPALAECVSHLPAVGCERQVRADA
jgi:hypothetical protein